MGMTTMMDYHRAYAVAMGDLARERATIADLRDRLRVLAASPVRAVCRVCGCAGHYMTERCFDCHYVEWRGCYERKEPERIVGACVSVGMRALCGRRILEGC